jgi:hypothetical protein
MDRGLDPRGWPSAQGKGLEHPVERVVLEQIAFLDIGAERRVALVAA